MTRTSLKILLFVSGFLLTVGPTIAQKTKELKANKEYSQYAYIDAQQVYLDVIEQGRESAQIFQNLGDTYYFNSQYKEAVSWYEALVEKFPEQATPEYLFRLSQCYKSTQDYTKAQEAMDLYKAKGGDTTAIARVYAGDDYLEQIAANARNSELVGVTVNSAFSDFGPKYFGERLVFSSVSDTIRDEKLAVHEWNNQPYSDLYIVDIDENGDLSNMERFDNGPINTKFHESTPTFSEDGKTMYFTRNNFLEVGNKTGKRAIGKDDQGTVRMKIYRATKLANGWSDVREVKFEDGSLNGDNYSMAHPQLSLDGKLLYFVSDMDGTVGMSDIWYAPINEDATLGDPVNLKSINTEARESFPFISSDNTLYFSSDGQTGLGGFDVFSTELDDAGMASEVSNLGEPTNSEKDDFGYIYNPETKTGYVASNRSGDQGFVSDNIYRVQPCLVKLTGEVTDLETGALLPGAKVELLDDQGNPYGEPIVVGDDAAYSFDIDCSQSYRLRATKLDYNPNEIAIVVPETSGDLYQPIQLERACPYENTLNCILELQTIYFDLDRFNIRPDAEIELAKVLAAMKRYPELVIHIESHTDSRATDQYNMVLSDRRAQSTMQWLIDNGIEASRLSAKGYGETQLVNECANDVPCSEEEHQLNRRSIFIIVD
ncbi:OmpA family protein [Gilvibacter sediminis]|uniref:OmpA family protein n=1 Tax=Gilvibacter sediminis TaxID=379071 RepID=UPI002350C62E|nr:OmpA family protein [Gilvibacter sediminis]MDC7998424.1 OmpA family protein [Gilvibacter sediminis]